MKPFVIVGMPRTGSTLLLRALQQHPDIQAYGELFHWLESERVAPYHAIHLRSATLGFDAASGDPLEFLREWVWGESNARFEAVGFKIFAEHAVDHSSPDFFKSLRSQFPGLRVLHIQRPNYLDVLASWLMAQQTGEWFVPSDAEPAGVASPTISASPDEAEAFFSRMESADRFFVETFFSGAYLPVTYEDLSQDLQATCDGIFDFLGIKRSPVVPLIRKQIDRDIREVVSNYNQLARHFADTPFSRFFKAPSPEEAESGRSTSPAVGYSANYRIRSWTIKR